MLNKVVLPYTIWYTGLEKILRLNLDKGIDAVTNISTKATLNGTSVNDLVSAIFNPKTKSIDITIRSDARMDVDGEMKISLSYSDAKTHESILVVSVRSHENTATETPEEVKQTKLTLLNGQSHTVGAADEQVVYSFDLVDRNVTDEFATYGDIKDMLISLGVTDSGEKDQYTILLEGDNLVLSKENDPSYRKVINLAKYHDEVSGEPLNVEDLKRDILSIVDGKLPNVETLKSDILAEAATKDTQLKADILHEVDGKIPNGDTIKQEILADVNPRIPDKDTLKTEILESAGEKDTALKTAILEEVGTRTTQNNQSLKQEIMGEVDSKLPNTAVLKEDILGEVDTKITTNNQTFKSTVMSEVDSKIPDVSVVKSEILNEVNPRLLDKETFKQEILSAIPAPANYTLTMEEDNLVLGKEGDASYRKVINLSKYRDEVTGQTVDVEQIKKDILAAITIPKAETIKEEIIQSLPTIPNYTLTLNENTLTLGKEGHSEYAKTINLSKYVNGPAVDTEQLKRDIIAAIHVPEPPQPSKLVNNPSVTNGVLKFNTETDAPTVDFTNDFYTKAKIDELLRSTNSNNVIFGTGRPDRGDHPNNNEAAGKIYIDKNSTDGAYIWFKEERWWRVLVGDTKWINLPTLNLYSNSRIRIRRINNTIYVEFSGLAYGLFGHIPYNQAVGYKPSPNVMRLTSDNAIPDGFKADNAFVGNVISDVENPGKILGSYAITGNNDLNYIKIFYTEGVPNKNVNDLRLQPAVYAATEQSWPTL